MERMLTKRVRCTGCSACMSVCKEGAIRMFPDAEGFLYPVIDNSKCLSCGLCTRVCPAINIGTKREPLAVYAVKAVDNALRKQSSSGGVFSVMAKDVLANGGVVYGAAFDRTKWAVVHKVVEDAEALDDLRGSKYVQSDLRDTFRSVAKDIMNGKKVLFTGTPCQVAGLRNYLTLRRLYPSKSLWLVDVVCHAAPSPLAWETYLDKRREHRGINSISFRNKHSGWKEFSVYIRFTDGSQYLNKFHQDTFMRGFLAELFNRPSCHNCPCKELRSGSDLTIGDFWGIQKCMPGMDDDLGTSLVLVNTGTIAFEKKWSKFLECRHADINDAIKSNFALVRSSFPHVQREYFFKKVRTMDFDKLVLKALRAHVPIYRRVRFFVGLCLRKIGLKK